MSYRLVRIIIAIAVVQVGLNLALADEATEFWTIYDGIFGRPNKTFDFNKVHEQFQRLTEFQSGDTGLDDKFAKLVAIGSLEQDDCSYRVFDKIDQTYWLPVSGNQRPVILPYREFCMKRQFLACTDQLSKKLMTLRNRLNPVTEEDLDSLSLVLAKASVDPSLPLAMQVDKLRTAIREYFQEDKRQGILSREQQLNQISKDCLTIVKPFESILLTYGIILQRESTASLVDEKVLHIIVQLRQVREFAVVVDKILVASDLYGRRNVDQLNYI